MVVCVLVSHLLRNPRNGGITLMWDSRSRALKIPDPNLRTQLMAHLFSVCDVPVLSSRLYPLDVV